uniref:NADH-ubiquinone oxidoreductase chain 1 n=1 Tax=Orbinia latreillii TaxID=195264 RepID=Q1X8Y2_9ANNE|nr:NADH dehydrogenase subunit 1 [Orbinia latreillii]AAX50149.1 NADH dehydrogenase subunit 1 [Orbinia latreillii]
MTLSPFLSTLLTYVMALLGMAFYTLLERKGLAYFQIRKGPNKVSMMGIPQPLADALKLFTKEQSIPYKSNMLIFFLSPMTALTLALILWSLYPHAFPSFFMPFSILLFLCISSFNVYTVLFAGWSSNSKYSLLGALQSIAQTISYEISMALILLSAICLTQTLNFGSLTMTIHSWPLLSLFPVAILWFITLLAETNRTPFDLSEGESELVSGFNIEYSSSSFALIFMAEYANILVMSLFTALLFIPYPWLLTPSITLLISFIFIWIRATLPRMRYDHLMYLTWKSFLPLSLGILIFISPICMILNSLI